MIRHALIGRSIGVVIHVSATLTRDSLAVRRVVGNALNRRIEVPRQRLLGPDVARLDVAKVGAVVTSRNKGNVLDVVRELFLQTQQSLVVPLTIERQRPLVVGILLALALNELV